MLQNCIFIDVYSGNVDKFGSNNDGTATPCLMFYQKNTTRHNFYPKRTHKPRCMTRKMKKHPRILLLIAEAGFLIYS